MLERVATTNGSTQLVRTKTQSENSEETKVDTNNSTPETLIERTLNDKEKEKVLKVVKGLNDFLSPSHTSLKFEFHEKLNEYYVTLIDEKTKEVVREIPSKKMLDFYAEMTQHIGLLVDKKI